MKSNYFLSSSNWPFHISAGGLIYRNTSGNTEVAIIRRLNSSSPVTAYSLPKGTLEVKESLENGALREVKEETGFDGSIEGYLGALHQEFIHPAHGHRMDRTTHYFLMKYIGGTVADQQLEESEEFDVEWRTIDSAKKDLKKNPKHEHRIIERAEKLLSSADK